MTKEAKVQLDSSKLLGFKQLKESTDGKRARQQAMVGNVKVGLVRVGA
jgi:hypothetical protein